MPRDRERGAQRWWAFSGWCMGLAAVLWSLHLVGTGDLATPPAEDPASLGRWIDEVGAANGLVAVARLGAIVATWYLVAVTLAGAIAHRSNSPRLVELTQKASPAFLRKLLTSGAGLTLSAVGLSAAIGPLLSPDPGPRANPTVTAAAGDEPRVQLTPHPHGAETARLESLEGQPDRRDGHIANLEEFDLVLAELRPEQDSRDATWLVESGDHLWSIAAETLGDAWDREPADEQVAPYWLELIEANRTKLVDPENPDLIYPGQVFDLPPAPSAPQS